MPSPQSAADIPFENRPKVYELEEKILEFSGLKLNEELFIYDVEISLKGKTYKIHTYRCGESNTEDLVLLHGYGGSSLLYYGMLKELSQRFRVFCLDFVGMGLSSKEKFECRSTEETLDFFLESVEKWREMVGLNTFYLAGHSFGGYISAQYTLRYQKRVKKLTLLSPAGITKHQEEPTIEEAKKKLGFFKKIFFNIFMDAWQKKMTPGKFLQQHPWLGRIVVQNYIQRKFNVKGKEAELLKEYLINMLSQPNGSQEAVHYLLKPPLGGAHIPLEESIIEELDLPVDCFYGEFDYMDSVGARRIHTEKSKKNFNLKILPKAAHQLPMENPKVLAQQIILSATA